MYKILKFKNAKIIKRLRPALDNSFRFSFYRIFNIIKLEWIR